jgi:CARDB protein
MSTSERTVVGRRFEAFIVRSALVLFAISRAAFGVVSDPLPNLVSFQPAGWSDKLVVSSQQGTQTDSNPLTDAQTLYVSWAVINNGDASTTATFTTELYVDGTLQTFWTSSPPLDASFYSFVTDYALGPLSQGTHTLTLKTDTTSAINESNEQDNVYTRMITVVAGGLPNLVEFQPNGWSDKLVVSTQQGTQTDSHPLTDSQMLYVSWAVINNGGASTTATFTTQLYVDGTLQFFWTSAPLLDPTFYAFVTDYAFGPLSAGTHTLTLNTDTTNAINESNEQDNTYTKMITISGGTQGATPTATRPPVTGTPNTCEGCVGDCNCDGQVTVDELLAMVNIALGNADASTCPAGDPNNDKQVTVDEILTAVSNALGQCSMPSGTFTPTATVLSGEATATPTATSTPGTPGTGSVPQRAAGTTVGLVQGLRAIPAALTALTQLAAKGTSSASLEAPARRALDAVDAATAKPCSGGGMRNFSCTQSIPTVSPRNYQLSFTDNCTLNTASGGKLVLDGMITAQSTETGILANCAVPPFSLSTLATTGLHVTSTNASAITTLDAQLVITSGSLSVTGDILSPCKVSAFDMTLTGSAVIQATTLGFDHTSIHLDLDAFSADCVPIDYRMKLNGTATVAADEIGSAFSGAFTNFLLHDDVSTGNDQIDLMGQVSSTCLGTTVTIPSTPMPISLTPGMPCPTGGTILVSALGTTDKITYTPSGGVEIDLGNNGGSPDQSFSSCLNSNLYVCPAGP